MSSSLSAAGAAERAERPMLLEMPAEGEGEAEADAMLIHLESQREIVLPLSSELVESVGRPERLLVRAMSELRGKILL